jgi:hypothetical protein
MVDADGEHLYVYKLVSFLFSLTSPGLVFIDYNPQLVDYLLSWLRG